MKCKLLSSGSYVSFSCFPRFCLVLDSRGRLGGKVGSDCLWGMWGQWEWYTGSMFLRVLVPAYPVVPAKWPLNHCCVCCVCLLVIGCTVFCLLPDLQWQLARRFMLICYHLRCCWCCCWTAVMIEMRCCISSRLTPVKLVSLAVLCSISCCITYQHDVV